MSAWNEEQRASLEGQVRAWIEWARQKLPQGGDIPPILNDDWDHPWWKSPIFNTGWDSWWKTAGEAPWVSRLEHFFDIDFEQGAQVLSTFKELDLADLPTRFVALSVCYALAHYEPVLLNEDLASQARDRHGKNLAQLIRLVPIELFDDWRTIRWEILNAYVIRDWDRARELYDRAEKLNLRPGEIEVLRAQFRFLAALAQETELSLESLFWPPEVYSRGSLQSLFLLPLGLTPQDPTAALPDARQEMLRYAIPDLETALAKLEDLSPAYRAVLARSLFLTGRYYDAAKEYERLENDPEVVETDFRKGAYMSAAASYRKAGETQRAIGVLEKCAADFQDAKAIYLRIAELESQQADLPTIAERLRKEQERNRDVDEQNWWVSPLIVAGETWTNTEADKARLRARPEYEQLQPLLSEYWPSFAGLDQKAKDEWVYAIIETHFCAAQGHIRDTYRRKAVAAFAQAVELELSSKVFVQFRKDASQDLRLRELAAVAIREKSEELTPFARFIEGKQSLTLGQMAYILGQSKNSNHPLFREFAAWVQLRHPRLFEYVGDLGQITSFRNPAVHKGFSTRTIEDVPGWCKTVIESLTATSAISPKETGSGGAEPGLKRPTKGMRIR